MPTTHEEISAFLASPDWTESEKAVIKWQFRFNGDFKTALWNAIILADDNNLERLRRGFPIEVAGFDMWHKGDLGQRLRKAGLGI